MGDRNIRLVLSYDGTGFCGYQIQPDERTVEGELQKALGCLLKQKAGMIAAGRTDSGVHARGQVVNFRCSVPIPPERFMPALNGLLPGDIRVLRSEEVSDGFDARRSARRREYRYSIRHGRSITAWENRYSWFLPEEEIDIGRLNRLAEPLLGEHDFATFAAASDDFKTSVRRLSCVEFARTGYGRVEARIVGTAFLRKMVRSIVGTLMELSLSNYGSGETERRLKACRRELCGVPAPARGLFLHEVRYDE